MRLSPTLSAYIARHFLVAVGIVLAVMLALVLVIDTVELLRRASGREAATLDVVAQMALLRIPFMAQKVLPFAVLFGGMLALARLTRSHELVVARAAGVSVWQFLLPGLALALALGVLVITVFNPLASATTWRFEQLEAKYLRGRASMLAVSSSGLWLREGRDDHKAVLHALRLDRRDMTLHDVTLFSYDADDRFVRRVDAESARLSPGAWEMTDVVVSEPGRASARLPRYRLATAMTMARIQESFSSPETMSFWDLPAFIRTLEAAGFSAVKHRLYWQATLAIPLLLCAMVLIAATFSLRLTRRGGTGLALAGGLGAGFLLYFLTDVVRAFGQSATIPVPLAAWAPAGVFALLGLAMLLHLEDG